MDQCGFELDVVWRMNSCGSENRRMDGCGLEKGWVEWMAFFGERMDGWLIGGWGLENGWMIIDRCGLENGWMMDDVVWRMDRCGLETGWLWFGNWIVVVQRVKDGWMWFGEGWVDG